MVSDSGKNFQEKREILQWSNLKVRQRTLLQQFEKPREILRNFNQNLLQIQNPKDKEHSESEATEDSESAATREARNAHQVNRDLSC